jgi:3-methyladenine DNA glycosylase AlkC
VRLPRGSAPGRQRLEEPDLEEPDLEEPDLVTDPSDPVRRLASEGIRPRLPWASRLKELQRDPAPVLAILDQLIDDDSLLVRRSVAKNLNDINKDHPDLVVSTCTQWLKGAGDERRWVIKHATRSLVKQGHPGVWPLLGFTANPRVQVSGLSLGTEQLRLGGALEIGFQIRSLSKRQQRLVVDFAVHHVKANGQLKPKVFKLKELTLEPEAAATVSKRHIIKPISPRKYYPGMHRIEVLVNGTSCSIADFELLTD